MTVEVDVPPECSEQDFRTALTQAEYILDTWLQPPQAAQQAPIPQPKEPPAKAPAEQPKTEPPVEPPVKTHEYVELVQQHFPEDLESMLSFELRSGYVIIKPIQFLGAETFAKIASIVRGIGGEYISAGKDTHFRVPTPEAKSAPEPMMGPWKDYPADIDKLPWKSFREVDGEGKKKLVGPNHAGWLFRNECDPELVKLLEKEGDKLELPPYSFKLSGADKNLVTRALIKGAK